MKHRKFYAVVINRSFIRRACANLMPLTLALIFCSFGQTDDWPTYQSDNQRSCVTSEQLSLPLSSPWILAPRQAPHAAWSASPAKRDLWHGFENLKPRVLFDQTNYVSVVGDSLYFGSSSDDMICCRSTQTGEERWVFFTDGPVRMAPTIYNQKVYFGSDDGWVYCLNAKDGKLIWNYKPFPEDKRILGNGRMISVWPIRTSVLVQDGTVYFGAGILPLEGVAFCALNADDGSVIWKKNISISPQGYLLSMLDRIIVPTGRTNPYLFDAKTGKMLGSLSSGRSGGTYAIIIGDKIVSGPGYKEDGSDWLYTYDPQSNARIASVQGNHLVVTATVSYVHTDDKLSALDRPSYYAALVQENNLLNRQSEIIAKIRKLDAKTRSQEINKLSSEIASVKTSLDEAIEAKNAALTWSVSCKHPYSLVVAGNLIFAGGDDEVAAYDASNGELLWTGSVMGKAYGLAIANGSLYVSTDRGAIHRFTNNTDVTKWQYY